MFTKKEIRALLVPLILEQILTGLMGMADTFMVSNVSEAAISGVALVDSLNLLVLYFFSALGAGGTIVCAQYIGHGDNRKANRASGQVMMAGLALSLVFCIIFTTMRRPVLGLIFGTVETAVMDSAGIYLLVTALSYPFLAVYTISASLHRAMGNSRRPMLVAAATDLLNVAGNAVLIFCLHMDVLGAALATLASRIVGAAVMLWYQAKPGQVISLGDVRLLRPDGAMLKRILRVGIPSAVENGMFQFGKLVIQSTVATLGTTAIAAQAVISTIDNFAAMPGMAIGTGLVTVTGQCMGSGRVDEARRNINYFVRCSTLSTVIMAVLASLLAPSTGSFTALSKESVALVCQILWVMSVLRVILWPSAFTLPNGLRAAGDVSFCMWVSTISMWVFRVGLSYYLCRYTLVGLWGIWIGWFADWIVRMILFKIRFRSGKWEMKKVLD